MQRHQRNKSQAAHTNHTKFQRFYTKITCALLGGAPDLSVRGCANKYKNNNNNNSFTRGTGFDDVSDVSYCR